MAKKRDSVKTKPIPSEQFRKDMRLIKTRWTTFRQLSLNLCVYFPPEYRDDLVQEATLQCIGCFSNWKTEYCPFRYFTSVVWNCMRNRMGKFKRWEYRHQPMPEDLYNVCPN